MCQFHGEDDIQHDGRDHQGDRQEHKGQRYEAALARRCLPVQRQVAIIASEDARESEHSRRRERRGKQDGRRELDAVKNNIAAV